MHMIMDDCDLPCDSMEFTLEQDIKLIQYCLSRGHEPEWDSDLGKLLEKIRENHLPITPDTDAKALADNMAAMGLDRGYPRVYHISVDNEEDDKCLRMKA